MRPEEYVEALYQLCLGHAPDEQGLAAWKAFLDGDGDPTLVLARLLESEGHRQHVRATNGLDLLLRTPGVVRLDEHARAVMTTSCRDTDYIPKVADAGALFERDGRTLQVMHNGVLLIPAATTETG
jgi:hypothetical protein